MKKKKTGKILTIYFIANSIKSTTKLKNVNILYFILCSLLVIITNYFSKYNVFLDDSSTAQASERG